MLSFLIKQLLRCPSATADAAPALPQISNLVAGVRYWEDDWEDEDLRVVLFSDLSHAEPLSPYRLVNLFGPEHLPQEFGNMTLGAGASSLRSELESLIHKTDITLQYVIDDPCSMSYYCVHHKDKKALNEGAALLSVANWLAHNVYADVEDIEDQIVEAVGDGRDLEIEVNKGTNVPENCLFDP